MRFQSEFDFFALVMLTIAGIFAALAVADFARRIVLRWRTRQLKRQFETEIRSAVAELEATVGDACDPTSSLGQLKAARETLARTCPRTK